MNPMLSGVAAALWLSGLWYVAPALCARSNEGHPFGLTDRIARRIRDASIVGLSIPLIAGALGLLFPATCIGLLVVACVARTAIRPPRLPRIRWTPRSVQDIVGYALPQIAVVAASSPPLLRPLIEGDSLGYHLPNAASWTVTHTLWTSGTSYWWYPGGSELFAGGLLAVAGPLALCYAGFVALLLLANRVAAFAQRAGLSALCAGASAAAVATIPAIALQGGSLENDVWLSAWLLELVWSLLEEPDATTRTVFVTSLIKPVGFLFAALTVALGRARLRNVLLGFIPIALWFVRDAVLWKNATISPSDMGYPNLLGTTIAAQGAIGFTTLIDAIWRAGPGLCIAFGALVVSCVASREPLIRWTALGTFLVFLVEPFGFQNGVPQLAQGDSLRFAFPAVVLGIVGCFPLLRRYALWFSPALIVLAMFQIWHVISIFENDTTTSLWYVAPLAIAAAIALDAFLTRSVATTLVSFALIAYTINVAGSHPIDYYNDLVSRGALRSHVFTWLAAQRPKVVVGDGIRLGSVVMVSPNTLVEDSIGADGCARARRIGALLVTADDPPTSDAALASRRERDKTCGTVRYDDGAVLVVAPRAP